MIFKCFIFQFTFIVLAAVSASIYFLFLCYMIWCVFSNISIKRSSLPSMSMARRLHYEGIIYRFKFLMLATLICAALTIVGFIMGQVKYFSDCKVNGILKKLFGEIIFCYCCYRCLSRNTIWMIQYIWNLLRRFSQEFIACGISIYLH